MTESVVEKVIAERFSTVDQCLEQLKSCGYENEASVLENNIAFISLIRIARRAEELDGHGEAVVERMMEMRDNMKGM